MILAGFVATSAMSAPQSGTGGIAVSVNGLQWPAAHAAMPTVTVTESGFRIVTAQGRTIEVPSERPWQDRFLTIWWKLHDPRLGYFSDFNLPYHSKETLIVEAPDYGHVTTSETFSYWAWLEAMYAHYTGDFEPLRYVYDRIERYAIPSFQPSSGAYNPAAPATYARENPLPNQYPSPLESSVSVGQDPLAAELKGAYGDSIYGMHWLLDTSNWYGYGTNFDPTFINTFQRGPQESVWETIPHPSIEEFRFGAANQGFLSLFTQDGSGYKKQWRYTNAPDADARLIQATWFARNVAREWKGDELGDLTAKAAKMGDYLRYAMFDKYFKALGCQQTSCPAGQGYESAHYLLAWYYSWGGSHPDDAFAKWSWRIGASSAHFGYQNPLTAYILSQDAAFKPKTAHGAGDWAKSLDRQLEFYQWLQAANGAIAGGATSSWNGQYASYPAGTATFHGMAYVSNPVYEDPGSNTWFGWQGWSMQRVAELYQLNGDTRAAGLLDRWVPWVLSSVRLLPDGDYEIPATLVWSGQPGNLSVSITEYNQDLGIAAAVAKTLLFYTQGQKTWGVPVNRAALNLAEALIARIWSQHSDEAGLSVPEVRKDYLRFFDPVYIPSSYQGKMASGAAVNPQATFFSLRPQYRADPDFSVLEAFQAGGPAPTFRYHRFWAQVEAAMAFAEYDRLWQP